MRTKLSLFVFAALLFAGLPVAPSSAQIGISVGFAPPAIPIYEQPYCPSNGYIWTPGYWAYDDGFGYYWVPGEWVAPPRIGFLWTPGYWGYDGSRYAFNDGYWGSSVGYYGGINYGYGYLGQGYYGGEWAGDSFRYNTAFSRVNPAFIQNTYVNQQVYKGSGTRASFNGPGGTTAKPTAQEQAAATAERIPATSVQQSRIAAAKANPALHAKNNGGKPKADAIKALSSANATQPATTGAGATQPAGKKNGKAQSAGNGNSAFGQKQGDAATRTKGSQNNAYGKAQSAGARNSHAGAKAARSQEATTSPKLRKASSQPRRNAQANPPSARRAQGAPRGQGAPGRQAAPARGGKPAPAKAAPAGKAKKKPAEEGGH